MRKKLQLRIDEPCSENWELMSPVSGGRHCASCQKNVIDFSAMSDQQLVAYFSERSKGAGCGRFNESQLNRLIETPRKKIPWLKYCFQAMMPVLMGVGKANPSHALDRLSRSMTVCEPPQKSPTRASASSIRDTNVIRGRVTDASGEGVPFVSITEVGNLEVTVSDERGEFEIFSAGLTDSTKLSFTSVGYEEQQLIVPMHTKEDITLTLNKSYTSLQEVVITASILTKGRIVSGVMSVRRTVETSKPAFLDVMLSRTSIYPNPARANAPVTIMLSKRRKGPCRITLTSAAGQLLYVQELLLDGANNRITFNLPALQPGIYFVGIRGEDLSREENQRLVVQ